MEQSFFLFFFGDRLPQKTLGLLWSSGQVGTRLRVHSSVSRPANTLERLDVLQACLGLETVPFCQGERLSRFSLLVLSLAIWVCFFNANELFSRQNAADLN